MPPKTRFVDLIKPLVNKNDTYWQRTLHMVLLLGVPAALVGAVPWSRATSLVLERAEARFSIQALAQEAPSKRLSRTLPIAKSR